jgi:hypothetical protein
MQNRYLFLTKNGDSLREVEERKTDISRIARSLGKIMHEEFKNGTVPIDLMEQYDNLHNLLYRGEKAIQQFIEYLAKAIKDNE